MANSRRSFLKQMACVAEGSAIGSVFTKVADAEQTKFPFLPTLEFLQEHNKDVCSFNAAYDSHGIWTASVYSKDYSRGFEDRIVRLYWENRRWIAVDLFYLNETDKWVYGKRIKWPNWLRKF